MILKEGGVLANLIRAAENDEKQRLESIRVSPGDGHLELWLNDDMLSYLTLLEAIELRDELNQGIKKVAGI